MCQRNLKLSSRKDDFKYIYDVHLWIADMVDLFWGFSNRQLSLLLPFKSVN